MKNLKRFWAAALLLSGVFSVPANADLVMSAPPRAKAEAEKQVYEPVAEYLGKILGERVEYRHPADWGIYQAEMQSGTYDIVFDGPHFTQWRVARQNHEILVKTPGDLVFVVVVKDADSKYRKLTDLRGHTICGLAPPNLATQTVLNTFGVGREPNLVLSPSFPAALSEMLSGKCAGAIMPEPMYKNLHAKEPNKSRVIYTSKGYPNQTITAGKKISAAKKKLLRERLVAPEAMKAMPAFMKQYTGGKGLEPANPQDYIGMEIYLKDSWGFGI